MFFLHLPAACSTTEFPSDLRPCQMYVDRKAEAIFVPLSGTHVPFHISTVKSVSKSEEGPVTYLRINFYAPGVSHGKDVSPSMLTAMNANPDAMYIRMINIKSKVRRLCVGVCGSAGVCLERPCFAAIALHELSYRRLPCSDLDVALAVVCPRFSHQLSRCVVMPGAVLSCPLLCVSGPEEHQHAAAADQGHAEANAHGCRGGARDTGCRETSGLAR